MPVNNLQFNSQLKALSNVLSLETVNTAAQQMTDTYKAATQTSLGFSVGQEAGGWQSLTQTVDYPLGQTATDAAPIVLATPSVESQAGTPPTLGGSETTDLSAILDAGTAAAGFLHQTVTLGTPEAIAAVSNNVWGATPSSISDMLSSVASPTINVDISGAVSSVLGNSFAGNFFNQSSNFSKYVTTALNGLASINAIKNVLEHSTGDVGNTLLSIAGVKNQNTIFNATVDVLDNNSRGALDKMVSLLIIPQTLRNLAANANITVDTSSEQGLVRFLETMSLLNAPADDVQSVYNQINNVTLTINSMIGSINFSLTPGAGVINGQQIPAPSESKATVISSNNSEYDTDFSYVDSYEEMVADLRAVSREVTTAIVHWTANFIDDYHVDAQQIKQIHLNNGWTTVGYHYLIRRDGSIQRCRNPNQTGAHAKETHNPYSIGIAMVGGYNCPNGTRNYESFVSQDSLSPVQWASLDVFLKAFYTVYPNGETWGHWQVNSDKIDPMVDMSQYVKNKFGKTNISSQPTRSYSTAELANRTFESY